MARGGLKADAVPFPLGQELGRLELRKVLVFQRMREHRRAEWGGVAGFRLLAPTLDPGEQILVGRLQTVPDQFDLVGLDLPELGHCRLGKARRDADPQLASDELDQRPAARLIEGIHPPGDAGGQVALARGRQRLDDLGEGRHMRRRVVVADGGRVGGRRHALMPRRRPDQGYGLCEVAHIVIGHPEQLRIGALLHEPPDQPGLGLLEHERPGHGGERIATIGIGGVAEIVGEQPQLGVAAGLVAEAVEEGGEAVHGLPPVSAAAEASSASPSSP
jgi:hypothetical protein